MNVCLLAMMQNAQNLDDEFMVSNWYVLQAKLLEV
jgi:hypothetical protein